MISDHAAPREWWRREVPALRAATAAVVAPAGNPVAFAALIAFTAILLVSPQEWFPAVKSLRIAFIAATMAIVAHLAGRMFGRVRALPVRREMVIALALIVWAAITIPLLS